MTPSQSVMHLVRTVERLPAEDQDRILRVVSLLTMAPTSVQQHSKSLLHELLTTEPTSRLDCVAELDGIIGYLEAKLVTRTH